MVYVFRAEINVAEINAIAKSSRLQCASFQKPDFFYSENDQRRVPSEIIAVSFGDRKVSNWSDESALTLTFARPPAMRRAVCEFWNVESQEWSVEVSQVISTRVS